MFYNEKWSFPMELQPGKPYVLTMLIDHMGLDENWPANDQTMKDPRGILDYDLSGRDKSAVPWKKYHDLSRGPLNDGAMFAE